MGQQNGQDGGTGRQQATRARIALAAAIAVTVALFAVALLWLVFAEAPPQTAAVRLAFAPAAETPTPAAPPSRPAARPKAAPPDATSDATPDSTAVAPQIVSPPRAEALPPADEKALRRVAVVVGGLGLNAAVTGAAIALPAGVSLAFSPYAAGLADWLAQARAAGHEALLELPMEPAGYPASDPGPQALLTGRPAAENRARLDWLLGRGSGYVGVTNALGDKFLAATEHLRPVLEVLAERDLVFIASPRAPSEVAERIARALGLPFAAARLALDARASTAAIEAALAELEALARAQGAAIGFASAYPATIARLEEWAPSLAGKGLVLVPVSAIARTPQATQQVDHDGRS